MKKLKTDENLDKEDFIFFSKIKLFQDLSPNQIKFLYAKCKNVIVDPGEIFIEEGDYADVLYIIVSGECVITKQDESKGINHILTHLSQGEIIGEMGLFGERKRVATSQAVSLTKLKQLSYYDIFSLVTEDYAFHKIFLNITQSQAQRMNDSKNKLLEIVQEELVESKIKNKIGSFFAFIILWLCLYSFIIKALAILTKTTGNFIFLSLLMLGLFCVFIFIVSKKIGIPSFNFTLNLKQWKSNALESILFSIPFLLFVLLFKFIFVHYISIYANNSIFDFWTTWNSIKLNGFILNEQKTWIISFLIYILIVCPFQEFLIRGVLQSLLSKLLDHKYKVFFSILISNLIFSLHHLYIFNISALIMFFLGIFFGFLYSRQNSIVGCTIAHILIGTWAIFIVGINPLILG